VAVANQALHINYGYWNSTLINSQVLAIHAALMPPKTNPNSDTTPAKILYFGGSQHDPQLPFGKNSWRLFDTETNTVSTPAINISHDLFCSGHAHTKDGDLLIVGGNQYYAGSRNYAGEIPDATPPTAPCAAAGGAVINIHKCEGHFTGTPTAYVFGYGSEQVTQAQSMSRGRWYPTVTQINATGMQLLALRGHPAVSDTSHDNFDISSFLSPSSGWTNRGTLATGTLYPRAHLTPYGGGLGSTVVASPTTSNFTGALRPSAGSIVVDNIAAAPNPADGDYAGFHTSSVLLPLRPSANGVYPPGKIMMTNNRYPIVLNLANPSLGWTRTPDRALPAAGGDPQVRMHAISTLLPTGDVLVTGGYTDPQNEATAVLSTEIYREDLNQWNEVRPATVGRNYHSTTLLMPDGRVWTAGGNKRAGYAQTGQPNGDGRELRIEIFEPWYYSLSRPAIAANYGLIQPPASGTWTINTNTNQGTLGTQITRVALLAPGSVTHAFNSDQRYVELRITGTSNNAVTVDVPANRSVLPSGWYLLFISRSSNGNAAGAHIPSKGRWVRIP
jgi:hypothetical protein